MIAFPDFNLLLISSQIEFWFVKVVPKYLNYSTLSKDLLSVFILSLRPAFWSQYMVMYLVLLALTSSSISLLATTKTSAFSFLVLGGSTFLPNVGNICITSAILKEYLECRMCVTTKVCLLQVHVNGKEYNPNVASPNKNQAEVEATSICLQALGILPSWIKFLINH